MKNWLTFWRNRRPFDLERALRASRPKPPADLVKAIMGDVRRRPVRQLRLGRALIGASALAILLVSVSLVAGLGTGGGIKQHLSFQNAYAACAQYATAPTITNVSPPAQQVGGAVTLTGTDFSNGGSNDATVSFNGTPATAFTINSDTSITATVPNGATSGPITVTTGCGFGSASFSVIVAPSGLSLASTTAAVGDTITINGSGLTGSTTVTFHGGATAAANVVSDSQVTAVVPLAATDGTVNVSNPAGNADTSNALSILPRITGFTPSNGLAGTTVTISGDHFTGATGVTFGGTAASSFAVNSDSSINAVVASGSASGPIAVTTSEGVGASGSNFNVTQTPSNITFAPTSGGIGDQVILTGQHFSGATIVKFNATAASFSVDSDTQITAHVPTGATTGKITVSNAAGSGVSVGTFTVIAGPSVSSFTPTAGVGGSTSVTIHGTHFTGASAVTFNTTPATSFTANSDTQITATVPAGATTGKVSVTTPGGTGTSVASFTVYQAPSITGMTPATNQVGGTVTLVGSGFTGTTSVKFNNIVTSFTVNSDSMITLKVPVGASGTFPFVVTTPVAPSASSPNFTVSSITTSPTVGSVNPTSGPANTQHQEQVVITGSHFTGASAVTFGGKAATVVSIDSDTQITATVPVGATTGKVVVTNAHGSSTDAVNFTVDALPTVIGFTPTSGTTNGGGTLVTITGANFAGATAVTFNGVSTPFTPDVATPNTKLTAHVPATATSGPISVTTADTHTSHTIGTGTSAGTFIVAGTPTISSFSPSSGKTGTVVTVNGTHFLGGNPPHVEFVGGTNPTALATVKSDTQLTVAVPAAATAGTYNLEVQNDAGNSAPSANTFTVTSAKPGPFTIDRSFGPANSQKTTRVILTGTNFTGATSVTFGSKSASFTVDSDTQITAFAPTGATTGPISVVNPSGSTAGPTFTVQPLPTVMSFTPAPPTGGVADDATGTQVVIKGTNFDVTNPDTTHTTVDGVSFNGTPAIFTVNSPTQITVAHVPTGATTGQITVTNSPIGSAQSAASFIVIKAPTITSFSPASGIANTKVTINGSGFLGNTTRVFFTSSPTAVVPVVLSDTTMTAMVPAGATTGPITVHNAVAPDAVSDDSFIVSTKPTVTSFSPSNGPASSDATTVVDISGSNFNGTTSVKFGTVSSPFVSVDDSTDITAVVPAGAKSGKVTVINPAGQALSAGTFTVNPPPVVKAITPNIGKAGDSVTITGSNFITGMGTFVANDPSDMFAQFSGDGNAATSLTATSLTVNIPTFAVTGPVEVQNIWGESALAPALFKVVQTPVVDDAFNYFFGGTAGKPGDGVEILGSGFTGTTGVSFGIKPASFSVVSDNEILATLPKSFTSGSTGVAVHVTNAGGTGDGPDFFLIQAPTITSFAPSSGAVGDTVTITGTGLEGVFDVEFNGTSVFAPQTFSVDSETQITAQVPTGATSGTISVSNEANTGTSSGSFTVTP